MGIKKRREQVLKALTHRLHVQALCQPSWQVCNNVQNNIGFLANEDIIVWCSFVANSCNCYQTVAPDEVGFTCDVAATSCVKAIEALKRGDEDAFMEFCHIASGYCLRNVKRKKQQNKEAEMTIV